MTKSSETNSAASSKPASKADSSVLLALAAVSARGATRDQDPSLAKLAQQLKQGA